MTAHRFADDELRPILVAWRRERQLLSAEDYQAWLAERGLTLEDMSAYLRRSAVGETTGDGACDPAALAAAVYPEAILGGRLDAWAQRLAQHAGARRALRARGRETGPIPAEEVSELVAAAKRADASGLDEIPVERLRAWAVEVLELEQAWSLLVDQVAARRADRTVPARTSPRLAALGVGGGHVHPRGRGPRSGAVGARGGHGALRGR